MRCQDRRMLWFEGSRPHNTAFVLHKPRAGWIGAYYVLAPKNGSISWGGCMERNVDFPVNPEWVFTLVEQGKITYQNARSELIRCAKGCDRRLRDLECWHKSKQEAALRQVVEQRQLAVRQNLRPFPSWQIVDEWLAEVMRPAQSRKRVLVLAGPSRTGKRSLCGACFLRGLFSSLTAHRRSRYV